MFKRIDHVEVVTSDVEKSIDFYTSTFNFKFRERKEVNVPPLKEVVYLDLGGTTIELQSVTDPAPYVDNWAVGCRLVALEVDNMDEALEYLKGKNIEATWGPVDLGDSKRAEIKDPDGLSIELREWYK